MELPTWPIMKKFIYNCNEIHYVYYLFEPKISIAIIYVQTMNKM